MTRTCLSHCGVTSREPRISTAILSRGCLGCLETMGALGLLLILFHASYTSCDSYQSLTDFSLAQLRVLGLDLVRHFLYAQRSPHFRIMQGFQNGGYFPARYHYLDMFRFVCHLEVFAPELLAACVAQATLPRTALSMADIAQLQGILHYYFSSTH